MKLWSAPQIFGSVTILFVTTVPGWAGTDQSEMSKIERAQSSYIHRIHSLETRFVARNFTPPERLRMMARQVKIPAMAKQLNTAARTGGFSPAVDTFYACKGRKYYYRERQQNARLVAPDVLYDGRATYLLTRSPSTNRNREVTTAATKTLGESSLKPDVLSFGYKLCHERNQWIGDLLRSGSYRVTGVRSDSQFGKLFEVQGQTEQRINTFWFAPKYGYLAVRSEGRDPSIHGARYVYRVLDLQQEHGLWFAKSAVRETYRLPDSYLEGRYAVEIAGIRLNSAPDTLFDPTPSAGGSLFDQDKNALYMVGPDAEKVIDRRYEVKKDVPYHLSMAWLFVGSLTILLFLGAGAFVRWRRQRAAF